MVDHSKVEKVEKLHDKFRRAKGAVLVDFRGLSVKKMTELRMQFREAGIEYHVVKNTLAKRASQGTKFEKAVGLFVGPISVALSYQDEVAPAKVLSAFLKKEPLKTRDKLLKIRGGVLDGSAVRPEEVDLLANLPAKPVLLSQLLSQLQAPMANLVGVLQGVLRDFIYVLKSIEEKKGPAEAASSSPEEAPQAE